MARFKTCSDCGRRVRGNYTRCYNCNMRRRRSSWHDPESLRGQDERDAELGRNEFYVYVLDTDYGHYVGHTANVQARLGAHVSGEVHSTAGGAPRLLWTSYALTTRAEAARFEAALKALRDQQSERFQEITGHTPSPFLRAPVAKYDYSAQDNGSQERRGRGCGLLVIAGIAVLAAALLLGLTTFQEFPI